MSIWYRVCLQHEDVTFLAIRCLKTIGLGNGKACFSWISPSFGMFFGGITTLTMSSDDDLENEG
jgi:hypothetical protein